MIRSLLLALSLTGAAAQAETLRLAATTSFNNSGLSDVLLPAIARDIGLDVQLLVVGTGQAIRLGQSGDVDAVLVHSKAAELGFVADGYGSHRREIMYNDFVLIGPSDDPAQVGAAKSVTEALKRIAQVQPTFVSRGDDSGTHRKELALWDAADRNPADFTQWYREVGAGMGGSLNSASAMNAYILADRASWLNFGNKANLSLLFAGDPTLFNQYAYLPVNPKRHAHVKAKAARDLENWLVSSRAKQIINGYKIGGEALFVFNARP